MLQDTDIAYLAGLIDGEGCIRIGRSSAYRHLTGRQNPAYKIAIQVRMVDERAIAFLTETLGGWGWAEKTAHSKNGRPLFCWQATDKVAQGILATLLPYLRIKKEQAELALAFRALQEEGVHHRTKITGYRNFPNSFGTPRQVPNLSYSDEYMARCEDFYNRSRQLNRVGIG